MLCQATQRPRRPAVRSPAAAAALLLLAAAALALCARPAAAAASGPLVRTASSGPLVQMGPNGPLVRHGRTPPGHRAPARLAGAPDYSIPVPKRHAPAGGAAAAAALAAASPPVATSYPPPPNWSAGKCSGYAFCVPGFLKPQYQPAKMSCPTGYDMENGLCAATVKTCLLGMKQRADGKCCADRTSEACYPSLDRTCGTEAQPGISICAGNPLYADIFSRIRVEEASRDENALAQFGKALVHVYLPRFDLGDTPTGAARLEEKQTMSISKPLFGRPLLDKSVILPKCFAKCCQSQEDQTCAPPTLKREYVEPDLTCPQGCTLPAGGRCICGTAAPAPCPAGTRECTSASSRICVPRDNMFGIDSCKMASLLMNHLPLVGCPTK